VINPAVASTAVRLVTNGSQPTTFAKTKHPKKLANQLVSLHWIPLSGEALNNSVWRASKKAAR
jgi:hypothetical protein